MNIEYVVINTQQSMDRFIDITSGFNDAILREVAVVSHDYVDADGYLVSVSKTDHFGPTTADALLVIQSQENDCPCIEILFECVDQVKLDYNNSIESPRGIVSRHPNNSRDRIGLFFGRAPGAWLPEDLVPPHCLGVVARSMKYRILGREVLGSGLRSALLVTEMQEEDHC